MNNYKITLSDGAIIENLIKNGTCYVSDTELTEDIFSNNLTSVIIEGIDEEGNEVKEEHTNMKLLGISIYKNQYYLAIGDMTEQELKELKIQSDIEYIAMMTDIDLEEE